MSWVWLALLSAFTFATADAATKYYFSDDDVWDAVIVRFVLSGALMAPWVATHALPPLDPRFWLWIVVLVPLDVLALVLYVRAITIAPLSHTLPYLAFTPVLSALSSWVLLDERLSAGGLAGILLVVAGAYLLNHAFAAGRRDLLAPLRFIVTEAGPRCMLGVVMIFSVTATLGKGALQYMPADRFGPFYALLLAVATWVVTAVAGRSTLAVVKRRPAGAVLVALAMAVMIVTHFVAIQAIEVAYMLAIKRTSMLFGLVYGACLFGERRLGQNLVAAVVMIAGAALIVRS